MFANREKGLRMLSRVPRVKPGEAERQRRHRAGRDCKHKESLSQMSRGILHDPLEEILGGMAEA